MNIVFNLFITLLDFWILDKYLKCFGKSSRCNNKSGLIILCVCATVLCLINQMENPNINLAVSMTLIYAYSFTYIYTIPYHIILPALYIGFGFVAELGSYLLFMSYVSFLPDSLEYPVTVFICEIVKYVIVFFVVKIKDFNLSKLPFKVGALLVTIPVLSVMICYIAINIIGSNNNVKINRLCGLLIIVMFASNILMYELFSKLINSLSENHNKEMLLQEAKSKEQYYAEVKNCNEKIRTIKHDLKNRLIALSAQVREKEEMAEGIDEIIEELNASDRNLYTANVVFNTILNNKIGYAESLGIKTEVSILIPENINMDYSDAGVLIGNLLDNAIEACLKIGKKERWMCIKIVYRAGTILLKIINSKEERPVVINKSSKHDFYNHGIGIPSIRRIVDKYNGMIEFLDKNTEFEVNASLYGIEYKQIRKG